MPIKYPTIDRVDRLSAADFNRHYLGRQAVLFTEQTGAWRGLTKWTHAYLKGIKCSRPVKIRPPRESHLAATRVTQYVEMNEYVHMMETHEEGVKNGSISRSAFPPYLHDTPLIKYAPELVRDFPNFPSDYLPEWYRDNWPELALFFIGPAKGLTPLHFDSCGTHNLFFQLTGTKRFIIVPAGSGSCCYRMNWHWSPIDAENPDYRKYPRYSEADAVECVIGPGEILYMPPRTWHQVRIIEPSISFNIDWHTPTSALRGVAAVFKGMPVRNAILYNVPQAVGLATGVKSQWMSRMMQAHLDYVD
jgi:hypothetical protein